MERRPCIRAVSSSTPEQSASSTGNLEARLNISCSMPNHFPITEEQTQPTTILFSVQFLLVLC